jgi:hypothetical protein
MPRSLAYRDICFRPQRRGYQPFKKIPKVEAADVETKRGYVKIIADSKDWMPIDSLDAALAFLSSDRHRGKLNFLYGLGFDVESIFKYELPVLKMLLDSPNGAWTKYNDYELRYIPGKSLTIRNSKKKSFKYFDAYQFFFSSLEAAGIRFLNKQPNPMKTDRARLFEKYSLEQIGAYCVQDANDTKELGEWLVHNLNSLGIGIKHPYSPAFIMEAHLLRSENIPTNTLPNSVEELFYSAYRGGWVDLYKRGNFGGDGGVDFFDLNSAYPAALASFPSIAEGTWEPRLIETADLGAVLVVVEDGFEKCPPIGVRYGRTLIYPYLDRPITLAITLQEYLAFKKYYSFDVLKAFSFVAKKNVHHPFEKTIRRLYDRKNQAEYGSPEYLLLKLMLNSIYGKTMQTYTYNGKRFMGKLFNFCYATTTTAITRIKLFEQIIKNEDTCIGVFNDGVMFETGTVDVPVSNELGAFSKRRINSPCLVVSQGVRQYFDDGEIATQGFSRRNHPVEMCNVEGSTITSVDERPLHARECFVRNIPEQINCFVRPTKKYDINADQKRLWLTKHKDAKELLNGTYKSVPVPVSLIEEVIDLEFPIS